MTSGEGQNFYVLRAVASSVDVDLMFVGKAVLVVEDLIRYSGILCCIFVEEKRRKPRAKLQDALWLILLKHSLETIKGCVAGAPRWGVVVGKLFKKWNHGFF